MHALARSGRCPPLSAVYPPHAADPDAVWAGIEAAIEQEDAFLGAYLDGPPQTNEVARSNAILGGCLFIAGKTGTPLELFEIGSSAGLNLSFDRYGYDLGVGRWGLVDAPVQIASRWEGDPPSLDDTIDDRGTRRVRCEADRSAAHRRTVTGCCRTSGPISSSGWRVSKRRSQLAAQIARSASNAPMLRNGWRNGCQPMAHQGARASSSTQPSGATCPPLQKTG